MRNEVDLLLCCASTHIDSEKAERIRILLRQNIDWDHLLKMALAHRVMPLLYRSLSATSGQDVPDAVLGQLNNHFNANANRTLFLAGELLKLLRLFNAHHISAMPFKGHSIPQFPLTATFQPARLVIWIFSCMWTTRSKLGTFSYQ